MSEIITDPAVLLAGGVEVNVRLFAGEQKTVKVRLLKIADFANFLALVDDFPRLAEFVAGEPAGWSDTLAPESLLDVAEKGLELNFALVRRWADLRTKLANAAREFKSAPVSPSPAASATSARTSGS